MSTTSDSDNFPFVPLSEPCLQGNEWSYVKECLDSGWISSVGSFVSRFESDVARYTGAEFAVATVNGTAALHTALLVAGVEPGDEVLVSTLTFIATANAVRYAGAHPVLIDSEPRYWQMDPALVSEFLNQKCVWRDGELINRATGRRVRAILPVHVLGHPADLAAIRAEAARFELRVVEDAAESLGASYQGRRVGAGADIACFSFNGNKTITCGGGGMLVTDSAQVAERARYLTTQAKDDPVEYIHHEVGFNYRLTNVLAALGVAQLEQLDKYVQGRRRIAAYYQQRLEPLGLRWHSEAPDARSTCWLSTAIVDPERVGMTAVQLRDLLAQKKIQTRRLWQPMHLSPAHRGCESMLSGVADRLFQMALSFPSTPSLETATLDRICTAVERILPTAARRVA